MSKLSEWRSGVVSRVTSSSQPPSRLAPSALPATADNRNTPCNVSRSFPLINYRWSCNVHDLGEQLPCGSYAHDMVTKILKFEDVFSVLLDSIMSNYRCICASRSQFSFQLFPFQHCCANFQVAGDRLPSRYEAVRKEGLMLSHSGTKPNNCKIFFR